jgi:hypothetical protein
VCGAHPHLQCAERMLDGLAALAHGLRVLVETVASRSFLSTYRGGGARSRA